MIDWMRPRAKRCAQQQPARTIGHLFDFRQQESQPAGWLLSAFPEMVSHANSQAQIILDIAGGIAEVRAHPVQFEPTQTEAPCQANVHPVSDWHRWGMGAALRSSALQLFALRSSLFALRSSLPGMGRRHGRSRARRQTVLPRRCWFRNLISAHDEPNDWRSRCSALIYSYHSSHWAIYRMSGCHWQSAAPHPMRPGFHDRHRPRTSLP
jgi:hypothetical protein